MSVKTTRKFIVASCSNIRSASYCELQFLLRNHEPTAYTSGVYGWNFDVYQVYGVTICTGYRGMPGPRVTGGNEYNERARAIFDSADYTRYDDARDHVETLLHEFCKINGGW